MVTTSRLQVSNMHINNLSLVIRSVERLNYIVLTGKLSVVIPGIVTLNYILLIGKLTVVIPGVVISNMYTANRQLSGRPPKRRGF